MNQLSRWKLAGPRQAGARQAAPRGAGLGGPEPRCQIGSLDLAPPEAAPREGQPHHGRPGPFIRALMVAVLGLSLTAAGSAMAQNAAPGTDATTVAPPAAAAP